MCKWTRNTYLCLQKDAFEKWLLQETKEHEAHAKSFGRRALHEKVANDLGGNLQKLNRHGIRKSYNKGKIEYIYNASSVYSVKGDCDKSKVDEKLDEVWTEDFEWIEIVTGLQSFLQILLEYLVVLDRIFVLRELGLNPQVFQIFDKVISPRNLLLYCHK